MPEKNVKSYNNLVVKLDKLAEGVKTHSAETNFPATLNEEVLRNMRADLEGKRETYESAENMARIKYDEYDAKIKELDAQCSKHASTLYGFYGKQSLMLNDFGLKPFKPSGKKGPRKNNSKQSN